MKKIALLITCISLTVASEELSLRKSQEYLFQNNFDIAAKQKEVQKAEWEISEALSLWYPSVDLYGNYNYLTEKSKLQYPPELSSVFPLLSKPISLGNNYKTEFGLDVSYPLFTGFTRKYNLNTKRLNKTSSAGSLQVTKNRAAYTLGLLYLKWHFSYKQQEVRQQHLQYLEEYAKQTKILSDGGLIASVKVTESQAWLLAAQVDMLESKQLTDSLTRELSGLIKINHEAIKPQQDGYSFDSIPLPSMIDSMRAELQIIQSNKDQLRESQKSISAQRLPIVSALAGYRVANPGIDMGGDKFMDYFLFGAQFKWNIFNGFKNKAQRSKLEKQMELLDIEKAKNIDAWNRSIVNFKADYQRSEEKIQAAQLSVKAADELVKALTASLYAGVVTSVDHLNALNSLSQAQLRLEQAIFQKRVAVINTLYASGINIQY